MTALNKQALRELAKALSGKEWVAFVHKASGTYAVGSLGHERGEDIIKWPGLDGQDNAESKAKFIAAANPATVLALLDELEAAEKRIEELEARTITVKFEPIPMEELGNRRDGKKHPYMFGAGYNSAVVHCESVLHQACAAAGIGVKGE